MAVNEWVSLTNATTWAERSEKAKSLIIGWQKRTERQYNHKITNAKKFLNGLLRTMSSKIW